MSFWSDVSDFFSGAAKAVGEAIDFVGQTVAGIIGGVGDVIDAAFDFAGATVESGATFVGKVVGTTFDVITGQYGKQNTIGQTIENAITTVGQLAGGLLDGVGELIGGTFNRIADAISYTSENVGEALGADLEEINASFDSFRRNIHRTLDRFEGDINPVSQETLGSGTPVATDAEKSKIVLELEDLFFQKNASQSKIDEDFIKTKVATDYELVKSFSSPGEIELHGFETIVMENKLTVDVVVAIGGTQSFDDIGDPDFTLDAITDMALGGPQVDTDAFNQAIAAAVNKARANGTSITFTGNSLGGALSEHAAYETAKSYADLRGRINSVSFDGFGAADSITIREGSLDPDVIDGINARYYYSTDDKIARIGNHLGTGFAVDRATNVDAQRTYTKAFGAHGDNLGQFATAINEYFAGNADELYQQRVDVNSAATGLGRVGIPLHQVLQVNSWCCARPRRSSPAHPARPDRRCRATRCRWRPSSAAPISRK